MIDFLTFINSYFLKYKIHILQFYCGIPMPQIMNSPAIDVSLAAATLDFPAFIPRYKSSPRQKKTLPMQFRCLHRLLLRFQASPPKKRTPGINKTADRYSPRVRNSLPADYHIQPLCYLPTVL